MNKIVEYIAKKSPVIELQLYYSYIDVSWCLIDLCVAYIDLNTFYNVM